MRLLTSFLICCDALSFLFVEVVSYLLYISVQRSKTGEASRDSSPAKGGKMHKRRKSLKEKLTRSKTMPMGQNIPVFQPTGVLLWCIVSICGSLSTLTAHPHSHLHRHPSSARCAVFQPYIRVTLALVAKGEKHTRTQPNFQDVDHRP